MESQQSQNDLPRPKEDRKFIILSGRHKGRFWCANKIALKHGLDLRDAIVARLQEDLAKLPEMAVISASDSKEEVKAKLAAWVNDKNDFGQCD